MSGLSEGMLQEKSGLLLPVKKAPAAKKETLRISSVHVLPKAKSPCAGAVFAEETGRKVLRTGKTSSPRVSARAPERTSAAESPLLGSGENGEEKAENTDPPEA